MVYVFLSVISIIFLHDKILYRQFSKKLKMDDSENLVDDITGAWGGDGEHNDAYVGLAQQLNY